MNVIMLMILIMVWLISAGASFALGFYLTDKKSSGKRKKAAQGKAELTDEEIYERDRKKREEANFWSYDGSPQDSV